MIADDFGVVFHRDHVGRLLRSLGWSPRRPQRRAVERNKERIRGWIREDWPRIKKTSGRQAWLAWRNESSLMMAPLMWRTWNPRGETRLLRHSGGAHRKVSVIGALCVGPDRGSVHFYFRLHPNANINADGVIDFLRQRLAQLYAPFVFVWD